MALKRSTSLHQGKLDSTGNEPPTSTSSHSGILKLLKSRILDWSWSKTEYAAQKLHLNGHT